MVGGFLAFLEDIGHAEGVAYLDEPIAQRRREAIVNTVETAFFPRCNVLLFPLSFHFLHLVAAYAETNLRPDAKPWNLGFVFVVLVPFAEINVEQ